MSEVHRISIEGTQSVLAERAKVARSFVERSVGLLGRTGFEEGEGLWIVPCRSIHMFGMRFAIDAVFIAKDNRVVHICHGLKPWAVSPYIWRAHSVIELPEGRANRCGVREGTALVFEGVQANEYHG